MIDALKNLKTEEALLGLQTITDVIKLHQVPEYKIRDRYYRERAKAIRKRAKSILSAQKVRMAKSSGVSKSAVTRETEAQMELDLMALVYEDEVMRYNAALRI